MVIETGLKHGMVVCLLISTKKGFHPSKDDPLMWIRSTKT